MGVDFDVGDVERDRGLALVGGPVWAAPMDATFGREDEPMEGLWLVLILGDENVAIDLHGISHPPLHKVGAVVEDLFRLCVAIDRGNVTCRRRQVSPSSCQGSSSRVLTPGYVNRNGAVR